MQIKQTEADNGWRSVFEMPIRLKVIYEDNSDTTTTVWNDKHEQIFSNDLKKPMQNITFDPDKWILKEVKQVLWTGIMDNLKNNSPSQYDLLQNYPNPFNPSTTIMYTIPKTSEVEVSVYSIAGQKIETLVSKSHVPGNYSIQWNGSLYSSSVYI